MYARGKGRDLTSFRSRAECKTEASTLVFEGELLNDVNGLSSIADGAIFESALLVTKV